jgi:glycosyltransferase involved in cell wall biosynthesis
MDYPPNVDAAVHLAREIFPAVRAARPGTRLLLVGRDPTPAVVALGDDPGVTVTGFVDDVRPYLDRAAVFVAPLRFGAGIQNKVLEALAMEVPVVATPLAAAGLRADGAPPPPLVVADDDGTMVARVVELLDRAAADGLPHREGRAFVEGHFGWAAAGARLEEVVAAAAAGRRAAPGPGGGRRRW